MDESLGDGLVGILQLDIFAHQAHADLTNRIVELVEERLPVLEVQLFLDGHIQLAEHLDVEFLVAHLERHVVDARHIAVLDDAVAINVAEEADFVLDAAGEGLLGATDDDVGLHTLLLQGLHAVLRRLGLQLAGSGDVGNISQMDDNARTTQAPFQLAHSLDERIGLDVAHGATDLGDNELVIAGIAEGGNALLDFVGDVGNHLHGLAQEVATALLLDDILVDTACGDVICLRSGHTGETLVVSQVEVGLSAVLGNIALTVLVGVERTRIDIDVGVELLVGDRIATGLEQTGERSCNDSFSKRGGNTSCNEYIFCCHN